MRTKGSQNLTKEQIEQLCKLKKQKDEIARVLKADYSIRSVAVNFGISQSTVRAIWAKSN